MPSTLLQEQQETYAIDFRCPLFRDFYHLDEALAQIKENPGWRALYGQESVSAGLLLAESRELGNYLKGRDALRFLKVNRPLYHLSRHDRYLANLYFSDRAAVEAGERVYDPGRDRFFSADQIKQSLLSSLRPLRQDIAAYLPKGEGYPLLSFDPRAGREVLIPLGTPLLFLGPYKYDDEEVLLHPKARLQSDRLIYPPAFQDKETARVIKSAEGPRFFLQDN